MSLKVPRLEAKHIKVSRVWESLLSADGSNRAFFFFYCLWKVETYEMHNVYHVIGIGHTGLKFDFWSVADNMLITGNVMDWCLLDYIPTSTPCPWLRRHAQHNIFFVNRGFLTTVTLSKFALVVGCVVVDSGSTSSNEVLLLFCTENDYYITTLIRVCIILLYTNSITEES